MRQTNRISTLSLSLAATAMVALLAAAAKPDEATAALYKQKCAACHGADGKADTPVGKSLKIRSFADPDVAKMSDAEMADVIDKGKGKMPAYGKSLKPEQITGLVAYIRTLAK